jgi:hypothetical protein
MGESSWNLWAVLSADPREHVGLTGLVRAVEVFREVVLEVYDAREAVPEAGRLVAARGPDVFGLAAALEESQAHVARNGRAPVPERQHG